MHARRTPTRNVFRYPVVVLAARPRRAARARAALPAASRSTARTSSRFRDRDHFDGDGTPLKEAVIDFAGDPSIERVLVLTQLRVLGYVFNPVSFYWCYRADGSLACMVAELNNTFGERLPELLRGAGARLRARQAPPRLAVLRARPALRVRVLGAGRRGLGADPRARGRRRTAAARPSSHGRRRELTNATLAPLARPLPADAAAGDRAHPLAGAQALAQARPVPPQAALRAGEGIGADVSVERRFAREPRRARRARRRASPCECSSASLPQLEGGTLVVRLPDGAERRFGSGPPVRMAIDDPRLFRRLATRGEARARRVLPGGRVATPTTSSGCSSSCSGTPSAASARHPHAAPLRSTLRPRLEPPQRPARAPRRNIALPLRPRQRALRAHARRDDDVLVRGLRATRTSRSPTRSGASCALVCEKLELGPGRPRARDRLRLGLLRARRRRRVRRARHRAHHLARAGDARAASASPTPGWPTASRSASRTTATVEGALHEGRVDRDARGDRRGASSARSSPTIDRAARARRARLRPDDPHPRRSAARRYRASPDWIERYVFPGCLIPSLGRSAGAARSAAPRSTTSRRSGRTTRETLAPLAASVPRARSARCARSGYDERFVRTWDFYLASCEAVFRAGLLRDAQLVVTR